MYPMYSENIKGASPKPYIIWRSLFRFVSETAIKQYSPCSYGNTFILRRHDTPLVCSKKSRSWPSTVCLALRTSYIKIVHQLNFCYTAKEWGVSLSFLILQLLDKGEIRRNRTKYAIVQVLYFQGFLLHAVIWIYVSGGFAPVSFTWLPLLLPRLIQIDFRRVTSRREYGRKI